MRRDLNKTFIDEIYSEAPKRDYPTNKIIYSHIDKIWNIDLVDMIDYKTSNNKLKDLGIYLYLLIDLLNTFGVYL